MKTNVELEYVRSFSYEDTSFQFEEVESDLDPDTPLPADDDVSQNDLGYFMTQAGRFRLLTAAEERTLGEGLWRERIRLLRILRRQRRSSVSAEVILSEAPVTASTRRRLARVEKMARELGPGRAPRGLVRSIAAIDGMRCQLVEANLRLVVWVAKKFRNRGFDFIDVIQEGSLGLMRAIDRYDPRVGARFSTFATHWIQQGIRRALAEKARTIRIPVNRIPEVRQTLYLRTTLSRKLGRTARAEDIAAEMGLPTSKIKELLPAIGPIDSIDAPIASTDRSLGDTLEDMRPDPFDTALEAETRRTIKRVLHELPDRQRVILAMRHGIGYPKECTLDEIGEALGLSRERIRQVEKVATASVRDWIRKNRPAMANPV